MRRRLLDSASSPIWVAACDMTGGASGGAWVIDAESGSPAIVSVTSAGGGKFLAGPVFDADTTALITAAETATANTVPGTKGRPGGLPCANRPLWACTKG